MNSCSGNGTFPSSSWDSWNLLPERSTSQWPGRCGRPLSISWEISHGGEIIRSWKGLNPFFLAKVEKKLHEHHLKSCILLLVVGPSTHQFCENARFGPVDQIPADRPWLLRQGSHEPVTKVIRPCKSERWDNFLTFLTFLATDMIQAQTTHTHTNIYDLWIFTVYLHIVRTNRSPANFGSNWSEVPLKAKLSRYDHIMHWVDCTLKILAKSHDESSISWIHVQYGKAGVLPGPCFFDVYRKP